MFVQGVLGALDGAPGGHPFDVVAHPVVDGDRVVAQFCGFGPDAGGELGFGGLGQVGLLGGLAGFGRDVELDAAYAGGTGSTCKLDLLVFVEVLVPGAAGLGRGSLGGLGFAPGEFLRVERGGGGSGFCGGVAMEVLVQLCQGNIQ